MHKIVYSENELIPFISKCYGVFNKFGLTKPGILEVVLNGPIHVSSGEYHLSLRSTFNPLEIIYNSQHRTYDFKDELPNQDEKNDMLEKELDKLIISFKLNSHLANLPSSIEQISPTKFQIYFNQENGSSRIVSLEEGRKRFEVIRQLLKVA